MFCVLCIHRKDLMLVNITPQPSPHEDEITTAPRPSIQLFEQPWCQQRGSSSINWQVTATIASTGEIDVLSAVGNQSRQGQTSFHQCSEREHNLQVGEASDISRGTLAGDAQQLSMDKLLTLQS